MDSTSSLKLCAHCGDQIPPGFLSCPHCQTLVYAEELKKLSGMADQAAGENRFSDALAFWREALELLPPDSHQYQIIAAKITQLDRQVDGLAHAQAGFSSSIVQEHKPFFGKSGSKAGLLGVLALLFSKFKFLLLGLGKLHTLFSMLLFFGVYWNTWGWKFALGFVLSLYIHEMGHVEALNRFGFKASAPMFIPFVGAFVRLKQNPVNPWEDARIGLAGPIWGLGAAVAAYGLFLLTNDMIFAAIARTGAWINLFNLMPFWQLDGGRGFRSLVVWQRWVAALVIAGMWFETREGLLLLLLALAVLQAFKKDAPDEPDHVGLIEYAFLIIILSVMCLIHTG